MKVITDSVKETVRLGRRLAKLLRPGDFVALIGIFGAGKTYFTKGIAEGLGVSRSSPVTSPSFVLCNVYQGRKGLKLLHYDAQRLDNPGEILRLGMQDIDNAIAVMEWGDKVLPHIKHIDRLIKVCFTVKGRNQRLIEFFVRTKDTPAYAEASAGRDYTD